MGRREQVLDAALEVLATEGSRGLSHRACDAKAGVPAGTTSNHFRTRHDLLVGALERLTSRGVESTWRTRPTATSEIGLVESLGAAARETLGGNRTELAAALLLYFEAVGDEDLAARFGPGIDASWGSVGEELTALGASDPEVGTRLLLGYLTAISLAAYVEDSPDFDPESMLEPLVWGLLH